MGIFSWFCRVPSREHFNPDFELFKELGEDGYNNYKDEENKWKQEFEDIKFERELRNEAYERFKEWRGSKCFLMDFTRNLSIRYVYDNKYSKFNTQEKINECRDKYFNEYKNKAISEAVYPSWFDSYYEEMKKKYKDNKYCLEEYFILYYDMGAFLDEPERELIRRKHFNNS